VGERRFDAELGYWLGVAHWGQGYTTEAVAALCDHAFRTSMLQRVHAVVYDGNPGSDRVLDKCGFVLEGLSRRAIFKNGRFLDCRTYARLKA
jgi:RimJ/RimL family protein N-acetyltransferase